MESGASNSYCSRVSCAEFEMLVLSVQVSSKKYLWTFIKNLPCSKHFWTQKGGGSIQYASWRLLVTQTNLFSWTVWQVFKKIKGDRDKMETLYLLSSPATSILSLRKQSSGKMERNLPRAKSQVRIFNLPGSVLWLPTSVREETKLETLTPLLISCKIFA